MKTPSLRRHRTTPASAPALPSKHRSPSRKTAARSRVPSVQSKRPFNIDWMMDHIRDAIKPFAKAAMFDLAERGHTSAFEQLVACIISIRTRDETMVRIARRLFAEANTPAAMAKLGADQIETLIHGSTFYGAKAKQIHAIAQQVVDNHGGEMPCDRDVLLSFAGVGPKCANLVMGIACGEAQIGVDVHVDRVTNRWGYVQAPNPIATMRALEEKLPRKYWVEINALLVPFGKHICTGVHPKCSTCPVLEMCRQVGVTTHR